MNAARRPIALAAMTCLLTCPALAEQWPQWRGPNRNGVVAKSVPLADAWPEAGPPMLWQSEEIPARDDGGLGSVVVAEGRAFLFVNWRRDDPITHRTLDESGLRKLGWIADMPDKAMVDMVETARVHVARKRLRGGALNDYVKAWSKEHLEGDEHRKYRGWAERRVRDGRDALSLELLAKLGALRDKPFADQAVFDKWLSDNGVEGRPRDKVVAVVPTTVKEADDVVVCLDPATGKTLWKKKLEGKLYGRRASSTPCVVNGQVFVSSSMGAACLNVSDGSVVWQTELESGAVSSSFLVTDGKAVLMARELTALDAHTGKLLWKQKEVRGDQSSPVAWRHGGKTYLLCHGGDKLYCVDAGDGSVRWSAPAGGNSTPVAAGDMVVVHTRKEGLGLVAYRMTPDGAEEAWKLPLADKGRGSSSPIIHDGHAYLLGGNMNMCIALATGKAAWQDKANTEISSPILADGKLIAVQGKGRYLLMLSASPAEYKELGKASVKALWCPSPALADGRLYVRATDGVRCFDLRPQQAGGAATAN